MELFSFNAPSLNLNKDLTTAKQDFTYINTGKFVRNCVLSSKTYSGSDINPHFIKLRDLIPSQLSSPDNIDTSTNFRDNIYGKLWVSNGSGAATVISPEYYGSWAPSGNGVDQWIAVKLPEAEICETYSIRSLSSVAPLSFRLEAGNDGETWTTIHTVESTGQWETTATNKIFTVPEATRGSYLYYRLYFTASNATTMTIYQWRLFRPVSELGTNSILIDASTSNPLYLSFADGYKTDGVTPNDHIAEITASKIITVDDIKNQWDTLGNNYDYIAANNSIVTPVQVYAVRNATTEDVTFSFELAKDDIGSTYFPNQRSADGTDQYGFTGSGRDAMYIATSDSVGNRQTLVASNGSLFYVSYIKFHCYKSGNMKFTYIDSQNISHSIIVNNTTDVWRYVPIHNLVKNLYLNDDSWDTWWYVDILGLGRPYKYKYQNGYVMQSSDDITWEKVQKIYLGYITYWNGEIVGTYLNSTLSTMLLGGSSHQLVGQ